MKYRLNRKNVFLIACLIIVGSLIVYSVRPSHNDTQTVNYLKYFEFSDKSMEICELPKLKFEGHEKRADTIPCRFDFDWGFLNDSKWHLSDEAKNNYESISCEYRAVTRSNDFELSLTFFKKINENDIINDEVIEVYCKGKDKKSKAVVNRDMLLAQIIAKKIPQLQNLENNDDTCTPLNVVLLSYDSVSHVSWVLRLKKTTEFITNVMDFKIMDGLNIIGDGTPAMLTPVLTGKIEEELPSVLKSDPKGQYVDKAYPFIWKELREKGYVSFFNEDWPQVGTWTYRLRGFSNETPTHYLRAYQMRLWDRVKGSYWSGTDDLCNGSKKRHKYAIDLLEQFYKEYQGKAHTFAFFHHSENSHDGNQRLNLIDDELFEHLKRSFNAGYFENTAIILYSDHGDRFNTDRNSPQGYLEERLPFLSIFLPKSYREKYPEKLKNLIANKQKLLEPFDIHATIRDLTCTYNKMEKSQRSISLLDEIPENRLCEQIDIRQHYCSCIKWRKLETSSEWSKLAASFTVNYINSLISGFTNYCVILELNEVISVDYTKSIDDKHRIRLKLKTSPNNGIYEANIQIDAKKTDFLESLKIDSPQDVSRVNRYGNASVCIVSKSKLDIRKFCFCKNQIA